MAAIQCDICGGSLSMDSGGDFAVCDSCGMKHTKDRVKAMAMEVTGTVEVSNIASIESLIKRARLAIEDSDWKQADEYFSKVLDIDPECAPAYMGKLFAELKIKDDKDFLQKQKPLPTENSNYQRAIRFADSELREKIENYNRKLAEYVAGKKSELQSARERITKYNYCLSVGDDHVVGLLTDGSVVAASCGYNKSEEQCNVYDWHGIVAVSAGSWHTVGLKADGTVVAVGNNKYGQCNVTEWRDIVAIEAASLQTFGLKSNGTVVAVGNNGEGQCSNAVKLKDIIDFSVNRDVALGLKANGTVVSVGNRYTNDVRSWRDIVAISGESNGTAYGLKQDGTIVSTYKKSETANWRDIVAFTCGSGVVGLKSDRTCIMETGGFLGDMKDIMEWRDIVAISADSSHIVGLKSNGTVVASACFTRNKVAVSHWRQIGPVNRDKLVKQAQEEQRKRQEEQRRIEEEKNRQRQREQEEKRQRIEQSRRWASQGLCHNCGGILGMFKKCKSCGYKN